jgi:alpha-1,2-mannosyltransferase
VANLVQPGSAGLAGKTRPSGQAVLTAGVVVVIISMACYGAYIVSHPTIMWLNTVDLHVYVRGGRAVLNGTSLYNWPDTTNQFTYPPFAGLIFTVVGALPWHLVIGLWSLASLLALPVTIWLTLGALGYRDWETRAGGTLLATAVLFWVAPVLHVIYLGQIELLLMALVLWDLFQPERRRWQGIGVGIAAGIKLVPLIFIPYLLLTRRYRQAVVAAATFVGTVLVGFALPADSRAWWLHGLFLQGGRIGFVGRDSNQSLAALITRLAGSVAAGKPIWLPVVALVLIIGLACAALLHRAGQPVAGVLTCALTGLLVSPFSWDHHWVWIVPIVVVLAHYGLRARGALRYAWLTGAVLVAGLFGAWPGALWGQPRTAGDVFEGLVYWPPGTTAGQYYRLGDRPWYGEYHWHGWQLIVGNLDLLTGLAVFVVAAVLAVRLTMARRRQASVAGADPVSSAASAVSR